VHYSADPTKTAVWAEAQKKKSPSENTFRREFEIDHYAGSGAAMYPEFSRSLHVCKPFPIPHDWTRYMGIDPHKRRPHAFVWLAVSPDGDHWYYRSYWPSRVYGKKGDTPEDDTLYKVDEYVTAIKFMESAAVKHFSPNGFADNGGRDEKIRLRVMDTHGKAIFTTTTAGKDEPETFWDRYEKLGIRCKEAIKDGDLLEQVADHKAVFFRSAWASYDTARVGTLQLSATGSITVDGTGIVDGTKMSSNVSTGNSVNLLLTAPSRLVWRSA